MLSLASWWPYAETLDKGDRNRVDHDCGDGRTLVVSRDERGAYRAFCFRCNDSGSEPAPEESLAARLLRLAALRDGDLALSGQADALALPLPQVLEVSEWPQAHRLWLFRAGFGIPEIRKLGAYYHPPTDRVVLPVYRASRVVFWQARAANGRQPKYMAPSVDRTTVLPVYGESDRPTLTEDILSAFKVGLAGGEGWSMMGTRVNAYAMSLLLKRGKGCNVWLDGDEAGQRGAAKVIKQLRAYNVPFTNIVGDRDPKLHTLAQIKEKVLAA